MEPITEEVSSEIDNRIFYSYCNTEMVSKMYTFVWNITEFFNIYKLVSNLKLNTEEERLPFNIFLQVDNRNKKVIFYVKATSIIKTILCHVQLQSGLSTEKYLNLPCVNDGENYNFEIDFVFLMAGGLEFALCDSIRVIFKLNCIETILHNTINTMTLHYNDKIQKQDLSTDYTPTMTVTLKIQNTEFQVNKGLLCVKSEYFKTWFDNNKTTIIDLDDISLEIAPMLANFINNTNTSLFQQEIETCNLLKLLKIAIKYNIRDLQIICEQFIKENIFFKEDISDGDILLEVLFFARINDMKDLLNFTIDFIALNINYINNSFFFNIEQNYPILFALLKEAKIHTYEAHSEFK